MTTTALEKLTVADYRELPETGRRYQLVDGDLYMSPAPNRFHQDISSNLAFVLLNYVRLHQAGKVYHAPFDVYLTENDVFQPDLIFVSKENARILTDAGAEGAPDLVIEILSPSTSRLDCKLKHRVYAQVGVKELWFVDPAVRRVEVYYFSGHSLATEAVLPPPAIRSQADKVFTEADTFTSPFFPGLVLNVAEFFQR